MNTHFVNYILLAIGILTLMVAVIMIFLDKLKGDDMYFNIDVKEQEIKKVIEDAEEILSELNFTSDVIVKEIEEKINNLNSIYRSVNSSLAQLNVKSALPEPAAASVATHPIAQQAAVQPQIQSTVERTTVPVKFKPMTMAAQSKAAPKDEKPKTKQQLIFELADQGTSVVDIAKRMNMGQGEVSLILSLKNEES